MGLRCPKDPVLCAIVLCLLAAVFQLVAVAGTSWAHADSDDDDDEVSELTGLFRGCTSNTCNEGWWKGSRAFSILGLLSVLASLGLGLVHTVIPDKPAVLLLAVASCAATILFLSIESAVSLESRTVYDSTSTKFGVDIVLSVFACGFSFFAALLFLMGRNQ